MSAAATWALVLAVLTVFATRPLLAAAAGDVARRWRPRTRRTRPTSEGTTRRRAGAELHVLDHEVRGWFGADDGTAVVSCAHSAPTSAPRT